MYSLFYYKQVSIKNC